MYGEQKKEREGEKERERPVNGKLTMILKLKNKYLAFMVIGLPIDSYFQIVNAAIHVLFLTLQLVFCCCLMFR